MSTWPVQWAYAVATVASLTIFLVGYLTGRRGKKKSNP